MEKGPFEQRLELRNAEIAAQREYARQQAERDILHKNWLRDKNSEEVGMVRQSARELATLLLKHGHKPDAPIVIKENKKTVYGQKKSGWLGRTVEIPSTVYAPINKNFWVVDLFIGTYIPAYTDNDPSRFRDNSTPKQIYPKAILLDEEGSLLVAESNLHYDGSLQNFKDKVQDPTYIESLRLMLKGVATESDLLEAQIEHSGGSQRIAEHLPKKSEKIMGKLEELGLRFLHN